MAGDRTEQATPHRKEKARKEGDLLFSRELSAAAGTLAGIAGLRALHAHIAQEWEGSFVTALTLSTGEHWEPERVATTLSALRRITLGFLSPVAFLMLAIVIASLGTSVAQAGGLHFHSPASFFRIDRINPFSNLRNLFSLRSAARMAKSLFPVCLLAGIAVVRIAGQLQIPPFSIGRLIELNSTLYGLLLTAGWIFFCWSAIDYVVEWRSRESRLKMSREDVREEYRETEGSPQIRSRIRGLQRQMRRRRLKGDVSKSTVVVTNPTHYAVALGFDFNTMHAPRVLAKGRNLRAEEIKSEARWAGVPIVENPPLARSLYRSVEEGQAIPEALYAAVAAILAFLYRQHVEREKRERKAQEPVREAAPASTALAPENFESDQKRKRP